MEPRKVTSGEILSACAIILGFALALISYFKNDGSTTSFFTEYIFWLIIVPFGIEAILVSISNLNGKGSKAVDKMLVVCFVCLFIALGILFSVSSFPSFDFLVKNSDIVGSVTLVVVLFILIMIDIIGGLSLVTTQSNLFNAVCKLSKQTNNESFDYIVGVSNSVVLREAFGRMMRNNFRHNYYGSRAYGERDVIDGKIDLFEKKIAFITDSKDNLINIVKQFEKNRNRIFGIVLTFEPNTEQLTSMNSYNTVISPL